MLHGPASPSRARAHAQPSLEICHTTTFTRLARTLFRRCSPIFGELPTEPRSIRRPLQATPHTGAQSATAPGPHIPAHTLRSHVFMVNAQTLAQSSLAAMTADTLLRATAKASHRPTVCARSTGTPCTPRSLLDRWRAPANQTQQAATTCSWRTAERALQRQKSQRF